MMVIWAFLIHFFKAIKIIGEVQFRTAKPNSARMKADADLINARTVMPNEALYPRSMVTPKVMIDTDKSDLVPSLLKPSSSSAKNLIDFETEAVLQLDHLMKIRSGKKKVPEDLNRLIEEQREVVFTIQKQIAKNKSN